MPSRMADIIQLISTMSDMQSRRQQLALAREQFESGKQQFNRKMGFDEADQHTKNFWKAYETLQGATAETKRAFGPLASKAGLGEEDAAQLLSMLAGMPTGSQTQTERAVEQGMQGMSPEMAATVNREAAMTRMTGMNQGQIGASGVAAALADRQQQMMASDAPANVAAIQQAVQGALPGWMQFQQNDVARGNLALGREQMNMQGAIEAAKLAAQLNSFKAMGLLTADQRTQAVGQMRLLIDAMTKKGKNDATRMFDMTLYNSLADAIGAPRMTNPDEAPKAAGMIERMGQSVVPPQATTVNPTSMEPAAVRPQPFNFMYQTQGYGQPPVNPIDLLYPQGRRP